MKLAQEELIDFFQNLDDFAGDPCNPIKLGGTLKTIVVTEIAIRIQLIWRTVVRKHSISTNSMNHRSILVKICHLSNLDISVEMPSTNTHSVYAEL